MATVRQTQEINKLYRRLRRRPIPTDGLSNSDASKLLTQLDREVNRKLASSVHRKELLY
jgi:hypothetical protein